MESEAIASSGSSLHWSDYVVIVFYFVGVLFVGFWSSKRIQGNSVKSYFLANRNMHWILVGASLFSTTVGSGSFVGLAGAGANSGLGIAAIELHAMYILLILGWFFVPVYISSRVTTMPEYMMKRFGGQRIRIYLSFLSLFLFIFIGISVDLYSGALFIKQALGLNMYISVVILVGISAILTISGGLTAVLWTDFLQTIIMLIGAAFLMITSVIEVGGYRNLIDDFATKSQPSDPSYVSFRSNTSCSAVTKYYKNLLRPPTDPELPSTGIIFGLTISAVWFWCSNQVTVQRALSAKNVSHAKAGCSLCSFLKVLNVFLIVLTGMAARVLWPNEIGCSNPEKCKAICGSAAGCSNLAYPLLVLRLMPKGATGLMLSVMMAALMSSLTSLFNSASTIFTLDLYTRIRKSASELELVVVGRLFVLFSMTLSILWIPIIESSHESQLFHYIQSIIAFLVPPICAVYVLAIFCNRINEKGAFWALLVGLVIGLIRFVLEFTITVPTCASGQPDLRSDFSKLHYMHFGAILFLVSAVVAIVVSLCTEEVDENKLYRLTFSLRFSDKVRIDDARDELKTGLDSNANQKFRDNTKKINKIMKFVCCVGSDEDIKDSETNEKNLSKVEEAIENASEAKEQPFWQSVNNFFAILVIVFASFIWGFYA